ncbi:MAG: ferritin-like domain-containing protein [Parvibaculum sp.]|uniref:ferritin-like domain-containing protein n=1 Tax=Parvibaculum sp. TaxID=2024848 RepID=UPI0025FDC682|nr:ferritin-like domain-containing protein [Parvibaculum sp.]MCE9648268.1 ferritin-like domain-containing protein [Parvibaculum sp.]
MTKIDTNITVDSAYEAVAPDDFPAMMEVERYNNRSTAFDKIISATHDHFWDPLDTKYIDFSAPFDMENEYLVDPELFADLKTAVGDKLDEKQKIKLVNLDTQWSLSSILHGEAGALALSASLCHILKDPGAQEYAANQTREEARHVAGFSRYIQARWGKPVQVGPALGDTLTELVNSPLVWKKIVGMQMLVEGLAMGAFATFYKMGRDPLMVKLMQLVMTDEAFHHKFGKIWADRTIPRINPAERDAIEDWAWHIFQVLLFNLGSPEQKKHIYAAVGLEWEWVQGAFMEAMTDANIREEMQESTNIFRVLIKTLLKSGIITSRTSMNYAAFIDMKELYAESDRMVGDDIAEEGIKYLLQLNGQGNRAYSLDKMTAAE